MLLLRPLGATFSPPAILQRPPNINLLDWLASKSKLKKSEEEERTTESLFPTSSATPPPLEESYYESFDYFPDIDHEYEAGAEIFEPEGQMLVVSMEEAWRQHDTRRGGGCSKQSDADRGGRGGGFGW